ncbi:membrane-associated oxidoreductase [Pseudomonas capsici]|uniref:membrane-associated oxidoreductase n=1 Tax=Pseudomonas capsici TaxID=2810614 RepID=UPI0021F23B11|nr:membrane-associated oxidoreductase [Pseudomonas capsici]MCV4342472.1 membrane-associated oxidoreductase [Pseudomonas capsici]
MKPSGRSLSDFGQLLPAEQLLLKCCRNGTVAEVGAGVPEEKTTDNQVRASFIRFLALGGDERAIVHEHGVQLRGAFITGTLSFRNLDVPLPVSLRWCDFEAALVLEDTRLKNTLFLRGSRLKGIQGFRLRAEGALLLTDIVSSGAISFQDAQIQGQISLSNSRLDGAGSWALSTDGSTCRNSLYLRGIEAKGGLNLIAMQIGGGLECDGARIESDHNPALRADRINVQGSVFLRDGFSASGSVRFPGARISGQFDCSTGGFDSNEDYVLSMYGAIVGGSVFMRSGFAAKGRVVLHSLQVQVDLDLDQAKYITEIDAPRIAIGGALILRKLETPPDKVFFQGGRVGSLNDDKESWGKKINLNGFVYGFIQVNEQMRIEDRLSWLDKQHIPKPTEGQLPEFYPQPWRQLQKVLEEMGHAEDARQVGIEFERRLRKKGLIGQSPKRWPEFWRRCYRRLMTTLHAMYGPLSGYGYRPMLLLPWFLGVWLSCAAFYWWAASHQAIFAPSDPLVFQNPAYKECSPPLSPTGNEPTGTANWYLCDALPQEYTAFSPVAFSLDLLLPLVNLHQEDDWAPVIETPKANVIAEMLGFFTSPKRWVRFVMWFEILAGWGFSLLFVAVVSGLARRKE